MAEFKITRFRYNWVGEWSSSAVTYYKDDVVHYQGSAWVCIRQHDSNVFDDAQTFVQGEEINPSPAWVKMADGRTFAGNWTNAVRYEPGNLVIAGGNLYICVASHVSSTNFNSDTISWELFATGSNFRNEWSPSTRYQIGDVVRYNGYTYQCSLEHVSGQISDGVVVGNNDTNNDSTAETWNVVVENYSYVGVYQASTRYRKNDLVKYGGSILKCTVEHTAASIIVDANFVTYLSGFEFDNEWNSTAYYAIGDVVRRGGVVYVAAANNSNSQPGSSAGFEQGNPTWTVVTKGINFLGEYDPGAGTTYLEGDVVRRGGALWISLIAQQTDDSSLRPLDTSNWQLQIAAQNFRGTWRTDEDYNLYDLVYFKGTVYYTNTPHNSSFENFPSDNGNGIDYWSIALVGDQNAALTILGDLITYNLTRNVLEDDSTIFNLGDGSSFGTTTVPIGQADQLLIVEDNSGSIGYKTWGNIARVFYVAMDGVDNNTDANRGINYFKPYRTVRYALEHADDNFAGTTTIFVRTGEYYEVLPLIVPARTVVVGEELRSTTIRPNELRAASTNDATYFLSTLTKIGTILQDIIQGNVVAVSAGNTELQNFELSATNTEFVIVDAAWASIIDTIDFKVNATGSMPAVTSTNTITASVGQLTTVTILENNREFIKAEVLAFMAVTYPLYIFDAATWLTDFDSFINAVQYDLQYPGNYKSVLAGRYYANAVLGSQLEDMFYVRDTTGLRNLSLKGLEGTLPPLEPGETYQIPTGGAFVSLDPGWGPDDERVWIIDRSCYVQNVTTFGYGAIGQKVDGLLHNGGNKSIVSNDFTQVISDGIGAWMLNGGRGELVSVFSYYAHIGMFALNGGIIRATNGNSSYGDFGAVADGLNTDEVVRVGKVNTRTEQAIVTAAFAGEILDFILALEFKNCGQNYTTASYVITSSGAGAVAFQEEFRDNAMFECQLLSAGSGFSQYGNQANTGGVLTITLATAETATAAGILGMRILITSGQGTGQYGYVYSYNESTKLCTVYRESDDQPGWDHIIPGTPSNPLLTTGSRYRIEPRPTFSEPEYSATEITLDASNAWAAAAYGETSQTFTAVTGQVGTGSTVEVVPAAAQFTVIKTGRKYSSIVLSNGGAGYAVGDVILIDGAAVGGTSTEHDIAIKVTVVSDDSTNSVLSFSIPDDTLIAASGKFILTPTTGHFGRYSTDGDTWSSFDLPSDGNWKCLAAGDNKFVAIATGTNQAASSTNGVNWTARTMPSSRNWNAVVYGKPSTVATGVFVAVASNLNAGATSINGTSWTATTLPSTYAWSDIAFGLDKFVTIAGTVNTVAVGTWNGTAISWQIEVMDVIDDSTPKTWVSIAYGNKRFVAISTTGDVAYSFDGNDWLPATMPTQDGSTLHNWKQIQYGQGVFVAVGDTGSAVVGADPTTGPTAWIVTSYDGIVWTERTAASELEWAVAAFGNPDVTLGDSSLGNSRPTWVIASSTTSDKINKIHTGARTLGRVVVGGIGVSAIKIWEPGSGYVADSTVTFTDPSKTLDPTYKIRLADGVLAQPTFISKGAAYKTSTTAVIVRGDGFADIIPVGKFLTVDNLDFVPGPGAQFYIGGKTGFFVAVLVGINEQLLPNGKTRSTFQVSPSTRISDYIEHDMEVLIREKYSQVRITGHDFLDIGTGNFEETNYPVNYKDYGFTTQPFQEVQNLNGGRVFYTSTDQDGNFRAGEQFAVEQATGTITIAADFFDLAGLTELRLAGINVGSTAVIREFSKDGLFLQNSNNVIPTQRAVRSYLNSRLNIGGEDLLTPSINAGLVKVGPNLIDNTADLTIDVPVLADFSGNGAGISGSILGQAMFFRSFK
jgi:lactate dehydrogenase-like 2-hydroxyacid dehydrogenase